MCRRITVSLVSIVALLHVAEVPAQTVEWWDRGAESYQPSVLPRIQQVKASPYGLFAVGQTDCEPLGCKGLLSKYDADGHVLWRIFPEVGELETVISGVDADASGIYVHGTTRILDPRPDRPRESWDTSFVQMYSHDGVEVWRYVDWFDGPRGYKIKESSGCSIAIDESGIYTTTSQWPLSKVDRRGCTGIVRKFSFDGQLLWLREGGGHALAVGEGKVFAGLMTYSTTGEFLGRRTGAAPGSGHIAPKGLAYYDGALYFCSLDPYGGYRQGPPQLSVYKTDLSGMVEWYVDYPKSLQRLSCAVDATSTGVYVAAHLSFKPLGTFNPRGLQRYRPGLTVRRWDFSGAATGAWDFPSLSGPPQTSSSPGEYEDLPYSISVLQDAVFLAGHDGGADAGFVARVSGEILLPPSVVGLDHGQRLAVLEHQYGAGRVSAIVESADGSDTAREVTFSDGLRPIDFFGTQDLNGNGRSELAVLSRRPPVVEVADSESGTKLFTVPLDADFEPVAASAVTDDSAATLAVLMQHRAGNDLRIEEFDAGGASLRIVPLDPSLQPIDLIALGSGEARGYAVLMANPIAGSPGKLEIRDIHGSAAQSVSLGNRMTPVRALAYRDHTGAERIAVLRRNADLGWQDVAVVDPVAGTIVYAVAFTGRTTPAAFAWSGDVTGDLSPQFTVAGRGFDGSVKAETRELVSQGLLHNVFLSREQPIQDLIYLAPSAVTSTPSLGLLVPINSGYYTPHDLPISVYVPHHRFALVMIDLLTGQTINELLLPDDDVIVSGSPGSGVIGNFVWHDRNGNGIQDPEDTGLAGVKVKLRNCGDPPQYQQTTFSDDSGHYQFRELQEAGYVVEFLPPEGSRFTTFQAGTDTATDSDAGDNGYTPCIDLQDENGVYRDDIDAGFLLADTP